MGRIVGPRRGIGNSVPFSPGFSDFAPLRGNKRPRPVIPEGPNFRGDLPPLDWPLLDRLQFLLTVPLPRMPTHGHTIPAGPRAHARGSAMNIGLIAMSGVRAVRCRIAAAGFDPAGLRRAEQNDRRPAQPGPADAGRHDARGTSVRLPRSRGHPQARTCCPTASTWWPSPASAPRWAKAYELADRYRARGMPVVLGGLHATALPEEAAAHADAVVVGEGEAVWPEVLRDAAGRPAAADVPCRRRIRPARGAHAGLPPAGLLQIQSPDGAGQPRMPVLLRVLRQLDRC